MGGCVIALLVVYVRSSLLYRLNLQLSLLVRRLELTNFVAVSSDRSRVGHCRALTSDAKDEKHFGASVESGVAS